MKARKSITAVFPKIQVALRWPAFARLEWIYKCPSLIFIFRMALGINDTKIVKGNKKSKAKQKTTFEVYKSNPAFER